MFGILKFKTALLLLPVILLSALFISGCSKKLPEDKSIGDQSYSLVNQDSSKIIFPDAFKGKILVMSFIYTNCPDICPLTTHNMQMIQEQVKKDNIKNVQFVELSFDPTRDTPSILKKYGDIRNINYSNFEFLTGKKSVVDTLIHHMNVFAIPSDTTFTKSGEPVYFFTHTDRITLLDRNGKIRNEYRGSKANVAEIIKDIKILGD
jgi:protein SCO1